MATLAEVAKEAGVSIATVSKVLSNTPYFTEETRNKVMAAVDSLGYVPNLAARALSTGKTNIIALVFPYVYDVFSADPLTQLILEGVESQITEQGYNLLLSMPRLSEDGPDPNYIQLLRSGYLDGIIALDNVPVASVTKPALKLKIPSVSIGYSDHTTYARTDDLTGSVKSMEHLLELGHKHIGILGINEHLNVSVRKRFEGLRQATQQADIDFDELPFFHGDFSIQSGAEGAAYLLNNYPNITAIISLNDRMAIGAIQEASRRGLKVPKDLSIIGYDDILLASLVNPALTTINQKAAELGEIATKMLFQIINGETPESVIVPAELIVRESTSSPAR